ncbi:MAG: GWxTD domain-containing protein [Bacteroidia bacterium]|nr:GWxTD domain-containing protein [Bacteroidia bacterium]
MKRIMILGLLLAAAGAQALAQEGNVRMYLDVCRFYDSRSGDPFAQIYVAVAGNSVVFRQDSDSLFQACVNISMLLQRIDGADTQHVDSDTYNLCLGDAQRLQDTAFESRSSANLLNVHQLRLQPGTYLLTAVAVDSSAPYLSRSAAVQEFEVAALQPGKLAFSDIKWVAGEMPREANKENRGIGRDYLVPLVTNSTFVNEDSMVFYQEIYHADQLFQEPFLIRCVIYQGDNRLWSYETAGQGRQPRSVNVYKEQIDISNLSSNIYYLQVELVNSRNVAVQTYRQKFYVYNSRKETEEALNLTSYNREADLFNEYPEPQLDYYLRTLIWRATEQEERFIQALGTYEQKKNFLYSFFEKRRSSPQQEVMALWRGHLTALDYVNQHFKSVLREGWQTDRGRVFLQYGIPNDVERFPAQSAVIPHEIWRYNRLGSQSNIVFVFYDPDVATNEYPLLHSNKYGELNNPRWRAQLIDRNQAINPSDLDYEDSRRAARLNGLNNGMDDN